jgi:hypothetical protein
VLIKFRNYLLAKTGCCYALIYLIVEVVIFMWDSIKGRLSEITTISLSVAVIWAYMSFDFMLKGMNGSDLDLYVKYGTANGSLATVFTGLALILLFYTIVVQRQEMKATRDVMYFQQVQDSLFQMLGVLNNIIEGISLSKTDEHDIVVAEYKGRRAFKTLRKNFETVLAQRYFIEGRYEGGARKIKDSQYVAIKPTVGDDALIQAWEIFWKNHRIWLAHYFRYLYQIMKFVDSSKISKEKKLELASAVRAQISDYELVMLFYNLKSPRGKGFESLCYKYKLLKHLPEDLLFSIGDYEEMISAQKDYDDKYFK